MPWFIPALIGIGVGAIVALAIITIKKIRNWIQKNKTGIGKEKVELIQQKHDSGDYNVVVGVYKRPFIRKKYSGHETFQGKKMDDELESRFRGKKKIVMKVDEF